MNYTVDDFLKVLNNFIDDIKKIDQENYTNNEIENLKCKQKEIINYYSYIKNSTFDDKTKIIIKHLELEETTVEAYKSILKNINENSQDTIDKITKYYKSTDCFDFCDLQKDSSSEKLIEIFGSIFGIQLSKEITKSIKAEKLGRILGYALSGLYEHDLKEIKKDYPTPELQEKNSEQILAKILDKINQQDKTVIYKYKETDNKLDLNVDITDLYSEESIRGRNRLDHCFINENTKTLHFGFSTSSKDIAHQNDTFAKAYIAMNELVSKEYINNQKNKFFQYKLEPFYFMFGRFKTTSPEKGIQEKGRKFLDQFPDINDSQRQLLAQMPFYSLCKNLKDNSMKFNTLSKYNSFIAGCDTLDIYYKQQKLTNNNDFYKISLEYFNNVLSFLNQKNNFLLTNDENQDSKLFIEDIVGSVSNMCFNIENLTAEDYNNYFSPIVKNLNTLLESNKIKSNSVHKSIYDLLDDIGEYDNLNKLINRYKNLNKFNEININVEDKIDLQKINQSNTKKTIMNLLQAISCISTLLSHKTYYLDDYLRKFSNCLNGLKNNENNEKLIKQYFGSKTNYHNSRNNNKNKSHKIIKEFTEKSLFLLKKDINSNYYDNDVSKNNLKELIKFITVDLKKFDIENENLQEAINLTEQLIKISNQKNKLTK